MDFYEEFAKEHDLMVPWNERKVGKPAFFKKLLGSKKRVLDCACGTGFHVVMLSKMGFDVVGSDLSREMLKEAKKNLEKRKLMMPLHRLDFRHLDKRFNKEEFDAVLCMGNSLPHLLSEKDVLKMLKSARKVLNKNGLLVLSIRNYDKLEKERERFMLRGNGKPNLYLYVLDYFDKTIDFNVLRINPKTGKMKEFKATYFKLKQAVLKRLLKKSGFKQIKFYDKKADFVKITARKAGK
jgi:ubiquinone/menaquinone biosynthesis C-methylase UbiE